MANRIDLLPREGKFYKANLHAHTTLSDGRWTPQEMKKNYQEKGYSVVAFTDHRQYFYHKELCDENFVALASVEVDSEDFVHTEDDEQQKVYHLNFYDMQPEGRDVSKLPSRLQGPFANLEELNGFIQHMNELGFLCSYNHPYWSLQDYTNYIGLKGLAAMEIYNHTCEMDGLYGYAPQVYDEMLRSGMRIGCFANDDNHDRHPYPDPLFDSFGGFNMIKAKELTHASIMEALKNRAYYASMGPEIYELYVEDGELVVECSPVQKIYVGKAGRDSYKKLAPIGENITSARFPLNGKEGYIRVDCRDEKGLHANSCAYFMDEIF